MRLSLVRRVHNTAVPRVRVVVCRASEGGIYMTAAPELMSNLRGAFARAETFRAAEIERDAARL